MGTTSDLPPGLGATLTAEGVDFAVYAGRADAVEICLFEADDTTGASETRITLADHPQGTWFGTVPGLGAGARYGIRAHGPWQPAQGLRYNHSKLLLDPYARAIDGQVTWAPEVFGHVVGAGLTGDPEIRDDRNSARYVPRAVVVGNGFDWGDDRRPQVPWSQTVIYETHVRNLTKVHPQIEEPLRGTFAGMAHPATIEHLRALGVTSVELLPVQAFSHEPELVARGLSNHWGYNTLGFCAPHGPYAASSDPLDQLNEFKGMVKLLHAAGLEVILDVVYNHTCEQARDGATLSWRGLDNRAYYRLDERGHDVDVTGCGNTLDIRKPVVARMVRDSLRYWVQQCHVDGFRFDLAVTLGRGRDDSFQPHHPFLVALRSDPLLATVKLIAEPWDLGVHGWRTGQFPQPFAEWNDRFRDAVRTFWLPDVARSGRGEPGHGVRELATRLSGSRDLFDAAGRGPLASVNYVAAHDGFTLADTTCYDRKHNRANGEGNRDGSDDNRSWNHDHEGIAAGPSIRMARRRSIRNLMATQLFSAGVPMINGGDELGRSQRGNNNPYCQDNDLSWFDWDLRGWQQDLLATTRFLTRLRAEHPVLGQRAFFAERRAHHQGIVEPRWFTPDGLPMHQGAWDDPHNRTLVMVLDGAHVGGQSLLIIFHGGAGEAKVSLPDAGQDEIYHLVWDSDWEVPPAPGVSQVTLDPPDDGPVTVAAASVRVYSILARPAVAR